MERGNRVIVKSVSKDNLEIAIREIMSNAPQLGKKVFLKANMYGFPHRNGITTHPETIRCVAEYLEKKGHEVIVGDIIPKEDVKFSEYFKDSKIPPVEFINLFNQKSLVKKTSGVFEYHLPKFLYEVDIVNIPVFKTHSESLLSGAIKNVMGLLPLTEEREAIHQKGLGEGIQRLYQLVQHRIKYHVVDGIYSMEKNGPISGNVIKTNMVFGGEDAYCVDSHATKMIETSYIPPYLSHLKRYELIGDTLNLKLKSPDVLPKYLYTGKAGIGFLGVFATMLGDITEKIGNDINFVFEGGAPARGKINIGINVKNHDYYITGNPPSRRNIRAIFNIAKEAT